MPFGESPDAGNADRVVPPETDPQAALGQAGDPLAGCLQEIPLGNRLPGGVTTLHVAEVAQADPLDWIAPPGDRIGGPGNLPQPIGRLPGAPVPAGTAVKRHADDRHIDWSGPFPVEIEPDVPIRHRRHPSFPSCRAKAQE